MFQCPGCQHRQVGVDVNKGVVWVCERCGGHVAAISALRKVAADRPTLETYWWKARRRKPAERQVRVCPSCVEKMKEVRVRPGMPPLDVCSRCQLFSFDPGEWELIPKTEPRTFESKEEMLLRVQRGQELAVYPVVPTAWQVLSLALGMPVEDTASRVRSTPWITIWTVAAVAVLSMTAFTDFEELIELFAFVPAHPWRLGGITLLTAFFLHVDSGHLAGNLYFLWLCGDNVEDLLGPWSFAALLVLSVLGADAVHALVDPHSIVPCIGASGGISGVMAFYALRFPRARLRFRGWMGFSRGRPRLQPVVAPVWVAFLVWLALQSMGLVLQTQKVTAVSGAAHIGGALVGGVFWIWEDLYTRYRAHLVRSRIRH